MALDVGTKRIGVAVANVVARLPRGLTTITYGEDMWLELLSLIKNNESKVLVVGLPRDINGNETDQTRFTAGFIAQAHLKLAVPVFEQDEANTSNLAESALKLAKKPYTKADIDAEAASLILNDFLTEHPEIKA